ncbi:MAG: formyl transferase [Candidatus Omnitrophica bacterium]|nr:formyl transferase [Candidatus Omnitrophota bacterium]
MRILFIGNVIFSRKTLEKLLRLGADVVGVVTKKSAAFNADFCDLGDVAAVHGLPLFYAEDFNAGSTEEWIRQQKPEVIFCFGVSQLLRTNLLTAAPLGVIGYHPALLPANRGRHPLIWALALGLPRTGSTFFFMDEKADSGDILDQEIVPIAYEDDAGTLYAKITQTALGQIERFLPKLASGNFPRLPQDRAESNVWRKRGRDDGKIVFSAGSRAIYNLTRALTRPYVGAHVLYRQAEFKVWQTRELSAGGANDEFGKILAVRGTEIVVRCHDGAVGLLEHELSTLPKPGEYFL